MIHLEITTVSEFAIKNIVKVNGNIISEAYFTRRIIRIAPKVSENYIISTLDQNILYMLTHDQAHTNEDVYIVDTVNGVAPTSLFDLAEKLSTLIR